jgi:LysM repeat protein
VNEGYKQASEISRNLILTFIFGIIIGTVIGWGARSTIVESPPVAENPPQLAEVPEGPAPEAPVTAPEPPLPTVGPATEPVITPAPAPDAETPPFDADVAGLWPAAHFFTGIKGTKVDVDTLEWLNEFKPGGVVLGPENVTDALQLSALVLQIKQATGLGTKITDPPLIIFNDPEHALPRLLAVDGDGSEKGLNPEAAVAQAREGLKQGVGVYLGPSLDMFSPGVSEARLELATLGTSSEGVVGPGLAYVSQLKSAGLMAVGREFPGAGLAVKSAEGTWHIPADQMDALASAMEPFKAAMDAGISGVLVGHMAVPGIDKERPNRPAALSPRLLQLLVRQDWQYQGLLIASDITLHPMTRDLPRDEIALKALFSGCDAVILQDADRATLRTICDTFVRLSKRSDFPVDQFAASRQRMRDGLGRLGTPVAAPAQTPAVVVAEAPVVVPEAPAAPPEAPAPVTTPVPDPAPATEVAPTPAPEPVPAPAPESAAKPEPAPEPTPEPAPVPASVESPAPAPAAEPAPAPAESAAPAPAEAPVAPVAHTIVKGDSLNALAKRYGVSAADLRTWNKMDSDVVKIGQVIKIQAPAPDAAPAAPGGEEKPPEEKAAETPPVETPQGEAAPEIVPAETPAPETTPAEVSATAPPAETAPVEPPTEAAPAAPVTTPQPPDTEKREHTVALGETLGAISGMYGVTVAEIQSWNGLDPGETVINAGAGLVVYLPVAIPGADAAPAVDPAKTLEPGEAEVEKLAPAEPASGTYELYEVATGDNLRRIAQRFGTTQQKLIEMNNLKSADLVQIGWKLKVPKQAEAPISGSTP